MKKVDKEVLKEASHKLLFDMTEEEYDRLEEEFKIILQEMEIFSQIDGLDDAEPMVFPYPVFDTLLREDEDREPLSQDEALKNAHDVKDGMIKLPKVVR